MMVAETLLNSVQLASLKSRFNTMSTGYFSYPPAGGGALCQPPVQESFPVSPLELAAPSLHKADIFSQRKQREFIPDNKKDDSYWDRRRRNNEAAKRSREKRRFNDMILESRVVELTKENHLLRAQLTAIREKFGIIGENLINREQVLSQLPAIDQILSFSKRHKTAYGGPAGSGGAMMSFGSGPAPPAAAQFRPVSPPPAPAVLQHPTPLVYRQQSLREPDAETPRDFSRPRSAEIERRTSPEFHLFNTAVNLSKPAAVAREELPSPAGGDHSSLPLKLRHKVHLGEREAAAVGLLALNQLKSEPEPEPEPQEAPVSPSSSADERDSGLSDRSASSDGAEEPPAKRRCLPEQSTGEQQEQQEQEQQQQPQQRQIRSELERLALEVASLKSLLNRQDSDHA